MAEKYKKPIGEMMPLAEKKRVILTVLSERSLHGYGIMKRAKEMNVRLPTGSLYRNISQLLESQLIEECDPPKNTPPSKLPRQYYRMTGIGARVLREDWFARADSYDAQRRHALGEVA